MKKIFTYLILVFCSYTATSQNQINILDLKGDLVFELDAHSITMNGDYGYFVKMNDGNRSLGFIDMAQNKITMQPNSQYLYAECPESNGDVVVYTEDQSGLLSIQEGRIKIPFGASKIYSGREAYASGATIRKTVQMVQNEYGKYDNQTKLYNKLGELITEITGDIIILPNNNFFVRSYPNPQSSEEMFEGPFSETAQPLPTNDSYSSLRYDDNYLVVEKDGKQLLIDHDGNKILSSAWDEINIRDNFFWVSKGDQSGLLNSKQEWIIPLQEAKSIYFFVEDECIIINKNGFYGMYSLDGQEMIKPSYASIKKQEEAILFFTDEGESGVINSKGEVLYSSTIYNVESASNNAVAVKKRGLVGLVDLQNDELLPLEYKDITYLGYGYWRVVNEENNTGLYHEKNGWKLEPIYEKIHRSGSNEPVFEILDGEMAGFFLPIEDKLGLNYQSVKSFGKYLAVY